MVESKQNWWEVRVRRSVDNLRMWSDNPRLDPSNKLITLRDFVEELIDDATDAQNFLDLMKSIVDRGFISFDPVVVWKEGNSFVVAEGNRRVMALKLLRAPEKAPISIRKNVVALSRQIDRDQIEKVKVCLAPSYEDARWYILQRHSTASTQVKWQRLQQQRFIIGVYDSVNQDIDKTIEVTGFKKSSIIDALRYVKIRDIATRDEITKQLSPIEKELVYSHKINMTVIERWFGNTMVREAWHIEFDETGLKINADESSFYIAYAKFLKLMLTKENDLGFIVNTRTIDNRFQEIFDYLPKVSSKDAGGGVAPELPSPIEEVPSINESGDGKDLPRLASENESQKTTNKGNPNRRQLTDIYHQVTTKNYKLHELFKELQKLPIRNYPNVTAASIRVFLDLSVDDYMKSRDLDALIAQREKKGYHECTLKMKLSFLQNEFILDREANKIISELLNATNEFSLNTLNEYIHGSKVHKVEARFLNRFWDMLSPLFFELIELREK
ncbi:MAG: ParB N-terminal domain-containing protein [Methyloprofundus sp.]|nr:ParB N-terminal domain-containing protein [Methyloprofundus sp.]